MGYYNGSIDQKERDRFKMILQNSEILRIKHLIFSKFLVK